MQIQRTAVLPATPDQVSDAVSDPDLLSAWLGPWTDRADGTAIVLTDDGVARRVTDRTVEPDGSVRWTWAPLDAPDDSSSVVLHIEQVDDEHTRLTVTEHRVAPAAATAATAAAARFTGSAERWTACFLALGALMSTRVAVPV